VQESDGQQDRDSWLDGRLFISPGPASEDQRYESWNVGLEWLHCVTKIANRWQSTRSGWASTTAARHFGMWGAQVVVSFWWFYDIFTLFFEENTQMQIHSHSDLNSVSSSTENMKRLGPIPSNRRAVESDSILGWLWTQSSLDSHVCHLWAATLNPNPPRREVSWASVYWCALGRLQEHFGEDWGVPRYSRHLRLLIAISVKDFRKFKNTTPKNNRSMWYTTRSFWVWETQRANCIWFSSSSCLFSFFLSWGSSENPKLRMRSH